MSKEAKLKKIIEKSIKNGYLREVGADYAEQKTNSGLWYFFPKDKDASYVAQKSTSELLFDKSFAKVIWGEETRGCVECLRKPEQPFTRDMPITEYTVICEAEDHSFRMTQDYKQHLQQAVISSDPIDYYYENM